ncbi:MAG: hypothetical protein COW02_13280 [Comamonadaceae bacterium CG12_big_fil_rev_8_21_14_0_65_59_15]|nr:hypothetical protein [Rhodoferax sp.]PIQ51676.1 MAG: hypothetical protein COW02_13280 [Comamonadaceae bacterium CG12_big_fil_rev_8_21_14_0_65_59_15]
MRRSLPASQAAQPQRHIIWQGVCWLLHSSLIQRHAASRLLRLLNGSPIQTVTRPRRSGWHKKMLHL